MHFQMDCNYVCVVLADKLPIVLYCILCSNAIAQLIKIASWYLKFNCVAGRQILTNGLGGQLQKCGYQLYCFQLTDILFCSFLYMSIPPYTSALHLPMSNYSTCQLNYLKNVLLVQGRPCVRLIRTNKYRWRC